MRAQTIICSFTAVLGLGLILSAGPANGDDRPRPEPPVSQKPKDPLPEGAIARLGDSRLRHSAPATCVAFSADGKQIFTGGQDQRLRVWDAATGEPVRQVELGFEPFTVRFTSDGGRLLIAGSAAQMRILHPGTLKELASFPAGAAAEFALSPDGKRIATVNMAGSLVVTDLATDLPRLELTLERTSGLHFAFHPDGKSIGVANPSGKVTFYLLAGGKPIRTIDHGGPITALAIRPDGRRLATGGREPAEVVKIWDLTGGPEKKEPRPVAEIIGASLQPRWIGGDRLVAGGPEWVGVYDLAGKKWENRIRTVSSKWAVSPDGSMIAAADGSSLRVRVWDLRTGKERLADNDSFPNAALLAPSADGNSLFILAGDAAFHWSTGRSTATPAGTLPARAVVAANGGKRLAVATSTAVLIYDDFDPSKPLPIRPARTMDVHAATPRSIAVSLDGTRVAYCGEAARIVIADANTGKTLRILPSQTPALALAFSPDGKRVAVLGRDAVLRLWAAAPLPKGAEDADIWKVRVQRGLRGAVAFSPDGRFVAASSSTLIVVVRADNGEKGFQLDRQKFDDGVFQQLAFTPDSKHLVTGSAGPTGAIHVFDLATQALVRRYATGLGAVNRLAIFTGSLRLATAGADDVITVWEFPLNARKDLP